MKTRKGISLITLIITIIVIIILAGIIINSINKNNPIASANEAVFKSDVSNFENELSMYHTNNYSKSLGQYEEDKLQADNTKVEYTGVGQIEIQSKTIKDIIIGIDSKNYENQFEIVNGKLAYKGTDATKQQWSLESGILVDNDKTNVIIATSSILPIKQTGSIEYVIDVYSNVGIKDIGDITSSIKVIDKDSNEVTATVVVGQIKSLTNEKQIPVTVQGTDLVDGEYKVKLLAGAVQNNANLKNVDVISINSFTVDSIAPTNPSIVSSPTIWTNQDVTATITYPVDSAKNEYSEDGTNWQTYTTALTVLNNCTVYARATDIAGNVSGESTLSITNIDKENPTVSFSPNGQNNVQKAETTVTVTDNSNEFSSLQYIWTTSTTEPTSGWTTFENNTKLSKDTVTDSYYLWVKAIDIAGNITIVKSEVFGIDNTIPEAPIIVPSTANWTNQNITINIIYPLDASKNEYSYDGINWLNYTTVLTISNNCTLYARTKDVAGNVSTTSTLSITNIDKNLPNISYNPNGSSYMDAISVSVNVSDSDGSQIKTLKYAWDTQNQTKPITGWNNFTNGQNIFLNTTNGTYYLWIEAIDNASNIALTVSNSFVLKLKTENYEDGINTVFSYSGNWIITSSAAYNGSHSYTNQDIGDNATSSTTFTYNNITTDGYNRKIDFWYKVSSETNFDFLTVTVNGVDVVHVSGEVGWTYFETNLLQGNNTIIFKYTKDGSRTNGTDSGYIDYIKIERANLISPRFTPDKTYWTNQNVNLAITYPVSATNYQYSFDGNTWYNYTGNIVISNNMTIYAKCSNNAGITSAQSTITITNIDKTPPVINYASNSAIRVVILDAGGSNVNTNSLQYVWSTSDTTPSSGWVSFNNGSDISRQNNQNLWIKCSDIAGNIVINKLDLNSTIVENYDIPNYVLLPYSGDWMKTNAAVYNGSNSYTNQDIGDSGTSSTTFTYNNITTDGYNRKIDFWYKVSSETNFDFLTVTVNGVDVVHVSGEVGWTYCETSLLQGNNTITFKYTKDGSRTNGTDSGYIDYIKIEKK